MLTGTCAQASHGECDDDITLLPVTNVMVFFFLQRTACLMRISDWSSDVCSSDLLKALADVTELRHVVTLAGAVDKPLGPFDSSMAILETGLFDKHGVETIGVAGHPEGSPDIAPAALEAADRKSTRLNSSH